MRIIFKWQHEAMDKKQPPLHSGRVAAFLFTKKKQRSCTFMVLAGISDEMTNRQNT
jgi:hypothetical protein